MYTCVCVFIEVFVAGALIFKHWCLFANTIAVRYVSMVSE